MQLTLACHPISEIRFGAPARDWMVPFWSSMPRRCAEIVLTDDSMVNVEFEIVHPGDNCRAGPIFDIVEPRAKAPGAA